MTADGERFDGFTSRAEERWLAGDGPAPATAAERLPPRAGVLVPRAGAGHRWVETVRTARLWVDGQGQVMFRDAGGTTTRRVEAGRVRGCWWVAGPAMPVVGLPACASGWLVLLGTTGPLLALRLDDWEPPFGNRDDAQTIRAAGVQGLAQALGADLDAVADADEAAQRIGQVPSSALLTLDRPPPRRFAAMVLLTPLVLLALYGTLLALVDVGPATVVAMALMIVSALAYDLVPWTVRQRRTARLPEAVEQWWPAEPARGRRRGAGLGVATGPAGQEVVIADGRGFEAWFTGPHLGGLASLVLAEDGSPWGLLALDREQRTLLTLAADDWVGRPGALDSLSGRVAGWGVVVSEATLPRLPFVSGRRLARNTSSTLDVEGNLAATFVNGVMTALFWVVGALGSDSPRVANLWWAVGAGLLLVRLGLRWRPVL